ncbi:MAG: ABC transporter ATP-binding protein [Spirochaetales bacterium]|nr:ABC transporter ATP-binding protein [Spirochaetales bacterium]
MAAVIYLENLTKSYGRERGVVDLNLEIQPGEVFGFIGPNGAGKSTTIRTILGLIFPSQGMVRVFGQDPIGRAESVKGRLGYMPSNDGFYRGMKVVDFLTLMLRMQNVKGEGRIRELSDYFELDSKRKIEDLSQGNRKKVNLVQALAHEPDLLILDEPTNGLDPLMRSRLFQLLHDENQKGRTIFFSSHTLSEVQSFCHRVGVIKNGRLIEIQPVKEIRKRRLKKIHLQLAKAVSEEAFLKALGLGGVSEVNVKADELSFLFSGEMNSLLKALNNQDVKDLSIEDPSLEEIFLHLYQ